MRIKFSTLCKEATKAISEFMLYRVFFLAVKEKNTRYFIEKKVTQT